MLETALYGLRFRFFLLRSYHITLTKSRTNRQTSHIFSSLEPYFLSSSSFRNISKVFTRKEMKTAMKAHIDIHVAKLIHNAITAVDKYSFFVSLFSDPFFPSLLLQHCIPFEYFWSSVIWLLHFVWHQTSERVPAFDYGIITWKNEDEKGKKARGKLFQVSNCFPTKCLNFSHFRKLFRRNMCYIPSLLT